METRGSGWLAWLLWVLTLLGLAATAWLDHLLRLAGRSGLTWSQSGGGSYAIAAMSAATVGAVVASRRPRHPVGWLLLGLGLALPIQSVLQGYVHYGLVGQPGVLPAAGYLVGLSHGSLILWLSCASFVLLLTPLPAGSPHRAGAGGPGWPRAQPWSTCWGRWLMINPCPRSSRRSGIRWRFLPWSGR